MFFKIFTEFTGKNLSQSLLFNKVAAPLQVLSSECCKTFKNTFSVNTSERLFLSVKHPYLVNTDALPDNYSLTKFRLSNLQNSLDKNAVSLKKYNNIIKDYLNEGIIEPVNPIQAGRSNPPPHHLRLSTSFSIVTSPKVGISFLTFSFNPFSTLL